MSVVETWVLATLAVAAQDIARLPSPLPMPGFPAPLVVPLEEDGRVDLVTLVREYASAGGWSLALDSETDFALERTRLQLLGELESGPDAAPLVFEALLESAGFALDAVWGDGLQVLAVAPRGVVATVPRALAENELGDWARHPAFEVELTLEPGGLQGRSLARMLRRWLGAHGDAFTEPRPSELLVLRGGARTVANAGALVRALCGDEPAATVIPPPRAAGSVRIVPGASSRSLLRDYARVTGQAIVIEERTGWWLERVHSRWQAVLEVPAEEVPLVFEEWLADHGLALVELHTASPRLARIEPLGDEFDRAALRQATFVPAGALELVVQRAARWYVTVFRFEHLDERALARELTRRGAGSPHLIVHSLRDGPWLIAVGRGRELFRFAEVLASQER